jgi:putative membrane protein
MFGRRLIFAFALSLGLVLGANACSSDDDGGTMQTTAPLTEAEVGGVLVVVNDGEIQEGELAKTKATSSEVSAFAQRMIDEHTATKTRQATLFSNMGTSPAESAKSTQLKTEAAAMLTALQAKSGAEFDRAYLADQVTMHQTALDTIDAMLLPSARSEALRAELQKTRADVATHLAEARTLQGMRSAARREVRREERRVGRREATARPARPAASPVLAAPERWPTGSPPARRPR